MAGRPSLERALDVWMNGEPVGRWTFASRRGHAFVYDAAWLDSPLGRPLSLSLPLSQGNAPFTGDKVEAYFDNLLPDSVGIRKRAASRFAAHSIRPFDLLEKIGRDCVGAVQLLPAGSPAPKVDTIDAAPLTEAGVGKILDATVAGRSFGVPEAQELRISIAGAQEKTALLWHQGQWCIPRGATPSTHIFKLPLGEIGAPRADFSTSVENEWLCSRIVAAYGLPVAHCELARFGRHKVLVVRRFDRRRFKTWWARLPQEDFCQVNGLPPEQKYEETGGPGISSILATLRGSETAHADRVTFMSAQLLFWLLAAPDGHAKNFSLFTEPQGRFRLTPLYDVISAWPAIGKGARQFSWQKMKLAMALHSKNTHYRMAEIRRRHWNAVAKKNALGLDFEAVIQRFIEATPQAIVSVNSQLPRGFPAQVSEKILNGLAGQVRRLQAG